MQNNKKKTTCLNLDSEVYKKLHTLCMVKKWFYCENDASISGIVNAAVNEYFQNHRVEIDMLMDDYHDKGGCAEL